MIRLLKIMLFAAVVSLCGCNDNDGLSDEDIEQAIADMAGTYTGSLEVSYHHGADIASYNAISAVSGEGLTATIPLAPMAVSVNDTRTAELLRNIGEITISASYEFMQLDGSTNNFILHPANAIAFTPTGKQLQIGFSQSFGGTSEPYLKSMIFNLSPVELWIDGQKYTDFRQLVYHFRVSRQ